jgi:hypothetical protein
MQMTHLLILLFYLFHYGRAGLNSVPFLVRSPHLNCWATTTSKPNIMPPLNVACDTSLWDPAPNNFDITILVRVDNVTYAVLGYESESVRYVLINNMTLSPTQTKVTIEAGPMQINLTFLNPIEPNDWVKQSIPFSYVSLTARSLDGAAHSVQVYTELVVEWPSAEAWGGRSSNTSDVLYYQLDFMGLSNGTPGVLYQATKNASSFSEIRSLPLIIGDLG